MRPGTLVRTAVVCVFMAIPEQLAQAQAASPGLPPGPNATPAQRAAYARSVADSTAMARPSTITGFASIPWGSPAAAVKAKFGQPVRERQEGGATVLQFKSTLRAHDAIITAIVGSKAGLLKGVYSVDFDYGSGCEDVFRDLLDAIKAKYPSLTPEETRYNKSSLEFCSGVSIGEAAWIVLWKDPENPQVLIGLVLKPNSKTITLGYEGPGFEQWADDRTRTDDRF